MGRYNRRRPADSSAHEIPRRPDGLPDFDALQDEEAADEDADADAEAAPWADAGESETQAADVVATTSSYADDTVKMTSYWCTCPECEGPITVDADDEMAVRIDPHVKTLQQAGEEEEEEKKRFGQSTSSDPKCSKRRPEG